MKLKLDAATSQRRDDVISIVLAAFGLFVCELSLTKWLLAQPSNQRDLGDYVCLGLLTAPFLLGLHLRRRIKNLVATEQVSVEASAQIKSDVGVLNLCYVLFHGPDPSPHECTDGNSSE